MKKISCLIVMMLITLLTINVKAGELWKIESVLQKGDNVGVLYNEMPTSVKRGDIITVRILIKNVDGWKIAHGSNEISWDKNAFEIVEVNGKYYSNKNADINYLSQYAVDENTLFVSYGWKDKVSQLTNQTVCDIKFKVKSDVKDGVYSITQRDSNGLAIEVDDHEEETYIANSELKYQVGNKKLSSNFTKDSIAASSYIIGDYLFTRAGSDEYNGVLNTEYIMLASKSIESNDKKDMIIYAKNARGNWINAITNQTITPPSEFKINFIDMKANYVENGIYSDSSENTILRLIQISSTKALVVIENDKEIVHGFATISGKEVNLTANGKTYKITIGNDVVEITTNDTNITSKKLYKRANNTMNDYYDRYYQTSGIGGNESRFYLKSEQNGKYVNSKYELYFVRKSDETASVCIKEKGGKTCLFDEEIYDDAGNGSYRVYTFTATFDEVVYNFTWSKDKIVVSCTVSSPYSGAYTKESSMTMEDVFDVWEKNEIKYAVTLDEGYEEPYVMYVPAGSTLTNVDGTPYESYLEGYTFVEWQKNGVTYDPMTPINSPISLKAIYHNEIPATPTLSVVPGTNANYVSYEGGVFTYNLAINSTAYSNGELYTITGYELYEQSNPFTPVNNFSPNQNAQVTVLSNNSKTYFVKVYAERNGMTYYSSISNTITLYPRTYVVEYLDGESVISSTIVPEGTVVSKPTDPTKSGHEFDKWLVDNVPFNFANPINSDTYLYATWTEIPKRCYVDLSGDYKWTNEPMSSWSLIDVITTENACVTPTNPCCINGVTYTNATVCKTALQEGIIPIEGACSTTIAAACTDPNSNWSANSSDYSEWTCGISNNPLTPPDEVIEGETYLQDEVDETKCTSCGQTCYRTITWHKNCGNYSCGDGTYLVNTNQCAVCESGHACNNNSMISCPDNYVAGIGYSTCRACAAGTTSNAEHTGCVPIE